MTLPLCESCHSLQDYPGGITHFAILGLTPGLVFPQGTLTESFHALSKLVHPDRFHLKNGPEPMYAQRWSSALNQGFRTLKERDSLGHYFLEVSGMAANDKPSQVPVELAEWYFEMQDLISSANHDEALSQCRKELENQIEANDHEWNHLAKASPLTSAESLKAIYQNLTRRRYLMSMLGNLDHRSTH